jgi:hypothetical protein
MVKIDFCDFWGDFNKTDNFFYNLLKEDYEVEISESPDYIFYSVFGNNHKNYSCTKIFYTGENISPDFNLCDYAFTFKDLDDPRNYRLPLYVLHPAYYNLTQKQVDDSLLDRKFCNFIFSNGGGQQRNELFEKLSQYKKVDSGGQWMNNLGYTVQDKLAFQSQYKFSIAFENVAGYPNEGYITEKILDPMSVNSVPIYKGGSLVSQDFNSKSFINGNDFATIDELVDYIIEIDQDDSKYLEMLQQPWFYNNKIPDNYLKENIKQFLNICIHSK